MGESTAEWGGGPTRSLGDRLNAGFVGFAAGVGFCTAFGVVLALLACTNHESGRAQIGTRLTVASVSLLSAGVTLTAQTEGLENAGKIPEKKPIEPAHVPPSALPAGIDGAADKTGTPAVARSSGPPVPKAAPVRVVSEDADPFKLSPPAVSVPAPFVLPEKPWFALEELVTSEPESCQATEAVCAANRSLNTALTWARSPAEAAEQARRDGKLVFLIHVSGNFEDPGFT